MLVLPNYRIVYCPSCVSGGWGFSVRLADKFPEFARNSKINQRHIEERVQAQAEKHGFGTAKYYRGRFCSFESAEGGLLSRLIVPGNAAGMSLELGGPDAPEYVSHNFDGPNCTSLALFGMTLYLQMIEHEFTKKYG